MFVIWMTILWFMDKICVWKNLKFRAARIQITSGTVNVGEEFGFNWVIANTTSIATR